MDSKLMNFIAFVEGSLAVKVTNKKEFDTFVKALKKRACEELLKGHTDFAYWENLAVINHKKTDLFFFEINQRSLTWSDDEKAAREWFTWIIGPSEI